MCVCVCVCVCLIWRAFVDKRILLFITSSYRTIDRYSRYVPLFSISEREHFSVHVIKPYDRPNLNAIFYFY